MPPMCSQPGGCVCNGMPGCNMPTVYPLRAEYPPSAIHDSAKFQDPPATESVLGEATRLTDRTRKDVYAHPSINFDRIARMWSVILGVDVTPEQHALCMIAVKISRLVESPGHRDSLVDVAGYARTIELLAEGGE